MGLKEGQGEKEVILECLPILKNVPANQTLMYLVLSRHVGQHICCEVLLPAWAAALLWFWLSWHLAVPACGFTNSCAHCELDIYLHIVPCLKGQIYSAGCSYCNLSVWGSGSTSDCQQPEKETTRSQRLGGISGDLRVQPLLKEPFGVTWIVLLKDFASQVLKTSNYKVLSSGWVSYPSALMLW